MRYRSFVIRKRRNPMKKRKATSKGGRLPEVLREVGKGLGRIADLSTQGSRRPPGGIPGGIPGPVREAQREAMRRLIGKIIKQ